MLGGRLVELAGGEVQGGVAVAMLADGGGHFGLGGVQPAAELARDAGARLVTGGADLFEGLGGLVEVEQVVGLFPGGEGEQGGVFGFASGGGGGLEAIPRGSELAGVDGLPSGEGGGVAQDQGKVLAAAGGEGVVQGVGELGDVGFEFGGDGGGAEPAVELADGLGLVPKYLDQRFVDVAGGGEAAHKVVGLAGVAAGGRLLCLAVDGLAGCDAQQEAGVVGHVEAVGYPVSPIPI